MPKLTVNGCPVEVQEGSTLIQACEAAGVEIPRFCYHERLAIAGNCRMCLVELERSPKLVASCALPASDGMVVRTNTEKVKRGREGVMEFLLINHPLDCPVCDQGGECDLQDQAVSYGSGVSRFKHNKRAVGEKYMGPLIKTMMTRCIHCTRCVRFADDVAGVPEALGTLNRGEDMEITALERAMQSELSGNIIDLCPVGALTSKPYAFKARPWEMKRVDSIDVMDAVGSNIRLDVFGREVMRVLPRENAQVNEEWISDKARFSYDGLLNQRLDRPYLRKDKNGEVSKKGKLTPATWEEAIKYVSNKFRYTKVSKIGVIAGHMNPCEDLFLIKEFMNGWGVDNIDCRPYNAVNLDVDNRSAYLFNPTIAGVEDADAFLFIGCNPRWDSAVLNARIKKVSRGLPIGLIGEKIDLNYDYDHLGLGYDALESLANGKVKSTAANGKIGNKAAIENFMKAFKSAQRPVLFLGLNIFMRDDADQILSMVEKVISNYGVVKGQWNGYGLLHDKAGLIGGLEVGCVPNAGGMNTRQMLEGNLDMLYLLGADDLPLDKLSHACSSPDTLVVYQGSHGDSCAMKADVILPGASYVEKDGTWINMEGRPQRSFAAIPPVGDAKEDWKIFRVLSDVVGCKLPFNNFGQVRDAIEKRFTHLGLVDSIVPSSWNGLLSKKKNSRESSGMSASKANAKKVVALGKKSDFVMEVKDFYITNSITRFSSVMSRCSAVLLHGENEIEGVKPRLTSAKNLKKAKA